MEQGTLVAFKVCPYAMRVASLIHYKKAPVKIEYIDQVNKPEWFLKISPFGKSPLLRVGETVLFESTVLLEYIDEVNQPSLQPSDPLTKALNQGYYSLASEILGGLSQVLYSVNTQVLHQKLESLVQLLQKLEALLPENGPYFNGPQIHLVDFTFSSVFVGLRHLQNHLNNPLFATTPKVALYSRTLLGLEAVQNSVAADYEETLLAKTSALGSSYLLEKNKPVLYGLELCPYYQRVKAFLELKKIEHTTIMVDLLNKPDWFLKISPLGKVPLLKVGDKVLFESAFIIEYLDETYGQSVLPTNPLEKCDARAWTTFAGEVQANYITLWKSKSKDVIAPTLEKGEKLLQLLEDRLVESNHYFTGGNFTAVDIAFACMFRQLQVSQDILKVDFYEKFPKVKKYSGVVLSHPAYQAALVENYHQHALEGLRKMDSVLVQV